MRAKAKGATARVKGTGWGAALQWNAADGWWGLRGAKCGTCSKARDSGPRHGGCGDGTLPLALTWLQLAPNSGCKCALRVDYRLMLGPRPTALASHWIENGDASPT